MEHHGGHSPIRRFNLVIYQQQSQYKYDRRIILKTRNFILQQYKTTMSLSSKIKIAEDEKKIEDTDEETGSSFVKDSVDQEPQFNNIMFISNCDITDEIRENLSDYSGIRTFDKRIFLNRTCQQLFESKVTHVWCNVSNKHAREWISKNVKHNTIYDIVIPFARDKSQKWIKDVSNLCGDDRKPLICKFKRLNKLRSLDIREDLMSGLSEIHSPISCIEQVLGCMGKLDSKKNKKF